MSGISLWPFLKTRPGLVGRYRDFLKTRPGLVGRYRDFLKFSPSFVDRGFNKRKEPLCKDKIYLKRPMERLNVYSKTKSSIWCFSFFK